MTVMKTISETLLSTRNNTNVPEAAPVVYSVPMCYSTWMREGFETHEGLLRLNTHPDQRRLSDDAGITSRVTRYYTDMVNGRWQVGADGGICFGRVGNEGVYRLLNGQHRLAAAKRAAEQKGIFIPFELHYYTFESEAALSAFFSTVDNTFNRTMAQRLAILGADQTTGLPSGWVRAASAAIRLIETDLKIGRSTLNNAQDIAAILQVVGPAAYAFYRTSAGDAKIERPFRLSPVFAIGILTFHFQPLKAGEFWKEVAQPEVMKRNSPTTILREYLISTNLGASTDQYHNATAYASRVARAWSAYYEGVDTLAFLRKGYGDGPTPVAGTPFNATDKNVGTLLTRKWIAEGSARS